MTTSLAAARSLVSATSDDLFTPANAFASFLAPYAATITEVPDASVETVGAGKEFATISAAIAASVNGTVIYVSAGTYTNDFATISNSIKIIGIGGMVNMVATIPPPNLKGILTVDNNVMIENVAFSGAAIDAGDGGNGAGIRYEGGVMVLENDAFMNNQNGILGAAVIPSLSVNTVTIDHSYFWDNGSGSGFTHNVYMGAVSRLTFTNNISEDANVGHELKSRALANTITGNVFADGPTGTASYEIDLPDGGADVVDNNTIEKGPNAQNNNMVHFGGEGIPYAGSSLTVENNTFQNNTGGTVTAVLNQTAFSATISGNTFNNIPASRIASGPAVVTSNVDGNGIALQNNTLTGVLPGSTFMAPDSAAYTVALNAAPYLAAQGGAGLLSVNATNGHIVVIGGSGGINYSESATSGGNQITTAAGSSNTIALTGVGGDSIDSQGKDKISVGQGNLSATISGVASVADGTGNNQYDVNGTATVTGDGGNPQFSIGAAGNLTFTGPVGFLEITNNGGQANFDITEPNASGVAVEEAMSIAGGAANIQVYQNGAGVPQMVIATAPGLNGATIRLRTGTASITSAGSDTIYADAFANSVIVEGAATIYAGTGVLSVFGRGDTAGAVIYGDGGSVTFRGDTGDLTYHGGALANTITNILSNDTLIGGAGRMTVVGGSSETITGGSGGIIYTSADGGGGNTITTAAGSVNTLTLAGADTIVSNGRDTIQGGTGNSTFTLNGTDVLDGSTGNSQVTINGTDTLYGRGQDWVTVNAGAKATIFAEGQGEYVTDNNGTVSLSAGGSASAAKVIVSDGAASLSASGSGAVSVTTNGGTPTTVTAATGVVDVASHGADLIHAGAGADVISLYAANARVWGGTSALTTINDDDYHAGDDETVYGGTGAMVYNDGGSGSLTFIGGAGASTINGGGSKLFIGAGTGAMTITGGAGTFFLGAMSHAATASITLTPYGGGIEFGSGSTTVREAGWEIDPTTYLFAQGRGGGTDVIDGFIAGTDKLSLGAGVTLSSTSVVNGSAMIRLSDGTSVQLGGITNTAHLFG